MLASSPALGLHPTPQPTHKALAGAAMLRTAGLCFGSPATDEARGYFSYGKGAVI